MIRRLHSRIIGMGSICGMTHTSPPAEVFLKTLPPPMEVDPQRYERFKKEEEMRMSLFQRGGENMRAEKAPEPFYDFVGGGAGHKHVILLLSNGNLVTFGDNAYGQTGAPLTSSHESGRSSLIDIDGSRGEEGRVPLYIDLGDTFTTKGDLPLSLRVTCGSNFTLIYLRGGRRVIGLGNNHVGQLGLGHKRIVNSVQGFEVWDPLGSWWPDRTNTVDSIVSGYNHSIMQLSDGSLYAFGSNTWGELGIGTTTSPMHPARIDYFDKKGIKIKKVALGNSFSLFLTDEGRVYGCGATDEGQLPSNSFEPVPLPLCRHYIGNGSGILGSSEKTTSKPLDPTKIIRVKDIACMGNAAVYLTSKNEVLVQGGLRDFGHSIRSPRLRLMSQEKVMAGIENTKGKNTSENTDYTIDSLQSCPQNVLIHYRNGCVGGLGANAEGELYSSLKKIRGTEVNVASAFSFDEVFPVITANKNNTASKKPHILVGKGFTLIVDNDSVFPLYNEGVPIELPSGNPHAFQRRDRLQKAFFSRKEKNSG